MEKLEIKFLRLHPNAIIPKKAHTNDCGADLVAVSKCYDDNGNVVYGTGLAIEIPEGYVGLIFPRSSIAKKNLVLSNSIGVIDSDYRGEILAKFKLTKSTSRIKSLITRLFNIKSNNFTNSIDDYEIGDRICQLVIMPYPEVKYVETLELSKTERGKGGYGSTGK